MATIFLDAYGLQKVQSSGIAERRIFRRFSLRLSKEIFVGNSERKATEIFRGKSSEIASEIFVENSLGEAQRFLWEFLEETASAPTECTPAISQVSS